MAYGNLGSKLSRAIAAYLPTMPGCGTSADITPSYSSANNSYPNTSVIVVMGQPEPALSGNYRCRVHVSVKGSAANATDDGPRAAFDARTAATSDALMQTYDDDGDTLRAVCDAVNASGRALATGSPAFNADMADFTCLDWVDAGFANGSAPDNEQGCEWEVILMYDVLACSKNVD